MTPPEWDGSDAAVPADGWPSLPSHVRVVEVGPRDGLQNIDERIPTETKIALIDDLIDTGLDRIEAVSFVHPRVVPQMADAEEVMAGVRRGVTPLVGLVPNVHGVHRALATGIDELNFVLSASESQNRWNLNRSIADSMAAFRESAAMARDASTPIRLTVSTAFGCPYEGHVPAERVAHLAQMGADAGATEICLGDTTGMAQPKQVARLFRLVAARVPDVPLAVHLHNTRGSGPANLLAALQVGVRNFDASVGGLGGCPFAPGATGNVCTEDMVHMLHGMSISTGVDVVKLVDVARRYEHRLHVRLPGQLLRAGPTLAGVLPTT